MNPRASLAFVFVLICAAGIPSKAIGQKGREYGSQPERHSYSGDGYILLQNGNVLAGKIATNSERIIIRVDGNSKLNLEHKNVEYIGPSLEALYHHQKSGIRSWGTGEHWHLAHWCIKQGLIDHAIAHYRVIEMNASDSPQFKQIEHMLREALLADEKVRKSLGVEPAPESNMVLNGATNEGTKSEVVQASAEVPKLRDIPEKDLEPRRSVANSWTQTEIPGYIRKTFQTSILPVLVTRCGQSGCHGILGKSDFHLYQPIGDQAALTLAKDLDEVLRYVDRERVHDSELLAYATKAHGIQRHPSLNASREDERLLIERIGQWIKSLALSQSINKSMPQQYPVATASADMQSAGTATKGGGQGVTQAIATSPLDGNGDRMTRSELSKIVEKRDRNASLSKPAKSAPPPAILSGSELDDLEKAIRDLEEKYESAEPSKTTQTKDPFDPDVFNRKFR